MKITDQSAYDKMLTARISLLVSQPFFGTLALHLGLEEMTNVPTMCTDGFMIGYNPEFVHAIKESEIVGVVAHEIMHCVYLHMTRRGNRHPKIYNIAGDYRINWDLTEAKFKLPGIGGKWGGPKIKIHKGPLKIRPKGAKLNIKEMVKDFQYCLDDRFKDMSTEEIYEIIKADISKALSAAGFSPDDVDRALEGRSPGLGDVEDTKANGKGDANKANAAAVEQEWETLTRMAISQARAQNEGKLPGYLKRVADDLDEPKINWRDLTRQFIDGYMRKDFSWQRPNRRYAGSGLHLPGFIPDAMHKLVMVLDVSGSITDEMMKTFASECAGALDEGIADSIVTMYMDTDVRGTDEFYQGDKVEVRTIAGGGTSFEHMTPWLKANHPDASCVVFLTDMQTGSWGEDPQIPMLWCAFAPHSVLEHYKPPYGQVVFVGTN